jgi:L-iditol 2-dehydrogenase
VKVLRLHAAGDLRIEEAAWPVAAPGEELVTISAVGLCGSDRHWYLEGGIGDSTLTRPLVLGHEVVGVVEEGRRRGLRVALDPADPCQRCDLCLAGLGHLCPDMRFAGHGVADGGLREAMAWPSRLLHPLPDTIADADATLLEPLGIVLHAIELGAVRRGLSAGVFGCGPIGLLLVQVLRAMGCAPILATDVMAHRLEAARLMGATVTPPGESPATSEPSAVDVAFEAAGDDSAVANAVARVRHGGRVMLIGIPGDDHTTFPAATARRKELSLQLCRRMTAADLPRAIGLVEAGRVDLGTLVSERHALGAARVAFDGLVERRGIKIVIEPGRAAGSA